jgi:hypothetical protein
MATTILSTVAIAAVGLLASVALAAPGKIVDGKINVHLVCHTHDDGKRVGAEVSVGETPWLLSHEQWGETGGVEAWRCSRAGSRSPIPLRHRCRSLLNVASTGLAVVSPMNCVCAGGGRPHHILPPFVANLNTCPTPTSGISAAQLLPPPPTPHPPPPTPHPTHNSQPRIPSLEPSGLVEDRGSGL